MLYQLIYIFIYPIFLFFKIFRKKSSKSLVIQTAKIGDYVNTSIIFDSLNKTDIIIDKINYSFAKNDDRIENIYFIGEMKKNKLKSILKIFWQNYENIYVVMPNSFNLFVAKVSFARKIATIKHYETKWYEKILMLGMQKIKHTVNDLTLQSYLKMINESSLDKFKTKIPLINPKNDLINSNKFKIGISLSAGNSLKTIDKITWQKIFIILEKFRCEYYIFGLESEVIYIEKIKDLNFKNPIISLLGKVELENLGFHISQMNLYISSDTGNSYIADSFKIPLINFAGPCYMVEQKPIGKNVLIVESNADCVPFSFIFKAPYESICDNLYSIEKSQEEKIENFITKTYKEFQS